MEKALRKLLPSGKFKNVPHKRSRAMASVRGSGNKTTELKLRMAFVRSGITGWKVRPRGLKGNPDFFFPKNKLTVFADGCFWHGCPQCGHIPKKNRPYWKAKIERNRARDLKASNHLRTNGFAVLRFWEHELAENLQAVLEQFQSVAEELK